MRLVRTILDHRDEVTCIYECSNCGKIFDGTYILPNFCPNCGRKLDKEGKPGSVGNTDQASVALAYLAIKHGLLKQPLPVVEEYGDAWTHEYRCNGKEPGKERP